MEKEKKNQPIVLGGKVIAITKVDNSEGRTIRVTLEGGVYFEVVQIKSPEIFKKLCEIADLYKGVSITIAGVKM